MSAAEYLMRQIRRSLARLDENSPRSRALLARLRRGVGKEPGEIPEILELTLGDLPEDAIGGANPSTLELASYTALTLYALHRQGKDSSMHAKGVDEENRGKDGHSFGWAAGRLLKPDRSNEEALKRRFDRIITAQTLTELAHHARGLVQMLQATKEPPITFDYECFAQDLYKYADPEKRNRVRLHWGRDFYRCFHENGQTPEGEGA